MFVSPAFAQSTEDGAAGPVHTETGVAHEGGGHEVAFPPFDPSTYPSQLLWLAVTFGLLYLVLKRAVLPRIGNILEVRRDRIAQDLDQAARMKDEADAAVAAYEQELADARAKANVIGQDARDNAKGEADAERREIEQQLEQKLREAEARIAGIKDTAMKQVGTIAEDTAGAIVQELVGGKVDRKQIADAVRAVRS